MQAGSVMRILAGGTWRLGDAVMSLPAVRALADSGATLAILAPGITAEVYRRSGTGAVILALPAGNGLLRAFRRLRGCGFRRVCLFSGGFVWALGARLAGIPFRAGLAADGRSFLLTHPLRFDTEALHQTESCLRIAAVGGGVLPFAPVPRLVLLDGDRTAAAAFLQGRTGDPYLALCPGASHPAKRWPAERFAALGRELRRRTGCGCLVVGSGEEAALVEEIAAACGGRAAAGLPPGTAFGLLAGAAFFVANNSGLAHAAAALGVPGLTLSGPSNPRKSAPRGVDQFFLGGLAGTGRERGVTTHPALARISVADALAALLPFF